MHDSMREFDLQFKGLELLPRHPFGGFTDEELLHLSGRKHRREYGFTPWGSWEVENSSFGRTLREWTHYPTSLPLMACSDHGVFWGSRCWPNEINSPYKLFLTWNKKKSEIMNNVHRKNSLHIPHPWLAYREKYYPKSSCTGKGTIVFFAHSNATSRLLYDSLDRYMQNLRDLPESFQPVVICLSFHDVLKGLHTVLRKYGFPIISAGATNSKYFVDRFYSISRLFARSTSTVIGSHSYYLIEMGIPFFLYGEPPTILYTGSDGKPDGAENWHDFGDEEDIERYRSLHLLLSEPVSHVTAAQLDTVGFYLGKNAEIDANVVNNYLWRSLLGNLPRASSLYLCLARQGALAFFRKMFD